MMVGNARIKETPHAFNQITIMFVTMPMLKILITKDIAPDIKNAMKNENTIF